MPGRARRLGWAFAIASWPAVAWGQGASFEDPYTVPTAPRPPTLPELTHAEVEATLETTAGALLPTSPGATQHAYVQRLGVEVPLGLRRWYVGATYEVAGGPAGGAFTVIGSNLVVDGRTLWATATGLAFGGGLGVTLPTATWGDDRGEAVATAATTLRPWDVSLFVSSALGVRPFIDVRAVDGPFVVQFRQGLDLTTSTSSPSFSDRRIYATAGVYLGWWAAPRVAAGLEAFETYAIDVPGIADGSRATLVASPNVRLLLPWVQPAVSMFTGLGKPFGDTTASIWGFRIAATFVYRPR